LLLIARLGYSRCCTRFLLKR